MCGRFSDTADEKKVSEALKIPTTRIPVIKPRYNVAPSQPVRAVVEDHVEMLLWGLVPSWAKDPTIGQKMINARSETVHEKPSFRGPFKNSRCLIIADGFYEWKKEGTRKQPYYIHFKDKELFTFGGLWSHWTGADGTELRTCTILTTTPNEVMKPLHHRMPVIIPPSRRDEWLDTKNVKPDSLRDLFESYPDKDMAAAAVSTHVNSPANDDIECVSPLNI